MSQINNTCEANSSAWLTTLYQTCIEEYNATNLTEGQQSFCHTIAEKQRAKLCQLQMEANNQTAASEGSSIAKHWSVGTLAKDASDAALGECLYWGGKKILQKFGWISDSGARAENRENAAPAENRTGMGMVGRFLEMGVVSTLTKAVKGTCGALIHKFGTNVIARGFLAIPGVTMLMGYESVGAVITGTGVLLEGAVVYCAGKMLVEGSKMLVSSIHTRLNGRAAQNGQTGNQETLPQEQESDEVPLLNGDEF